jgi:hypothetical protein
MLAAGAKGGLETVKYLVETANVPLNDQDLSDATALHYGIYI